MVLDAADKSKIYKQKLLEDALTNNIVVKTIVFFIEVRLMYTDS